MPRDAPDADLNYNAVDDEDPDTLPALRKRVVVKDNSAPSHAGPENREHGGISQGGGNEKTSKSTEACAERHNDNVNSKDQAAVTGFRVADEDEERTAGAVHNIDCRNFIDSATPSNSQAVEGGKQRGKIDYKNDKETSSLLAVTKYDGHGDAFVRKESHALIVVLVRESENEVTAVEKTTAAVDAIKSTRPTPFYSDKFEKATSSLLRNNLSVDVGDGGRSIHALERKVLLLYLVMLYRQNEMQAKADLVMKAQ